MLKFLTLGTLLVLGCLFITFKVLESVEFEPQETVLATIEKCTADLAYGAPSKINCLTKISDDHIIFVESFGQVAVNYKGKVELQKHVGKYTGRSKYTLIKPI